MTRAAMILAAGFGTRMGALTADRPKPLLEVGRRPLLEHAIAAAASVGADPVVVNGHHHADQIGAFLAQHHPDVRFSEERPEILDSGGGIKNALPQLGERPIFTLNADAVWRGPSPLAVLEAAWEDARMGGLVLLVPRRDAVGRRGGGDFSMDARGRIGWDKGPTGWVHTGAQILDTKPLASHPSAVFSLREVWQDLIDQGRLFGVVYPGRWADVGHPEGLQQAEAMLTDG